MIALVACGAEEPSWPASPCDPEPADGEGACLAEVVGPNFNLWSAKDTESNAGQLGGSGVAMEFKVRHTMQVHGGTVDVTDSVQLDREPFTPLESFVLDIAPKNPDDYANGAFFTRTQHGCTTEGPSVQPDCEGSISDSGMASSGTIRCDWPDATHLRCQFHDLTFKTYAGELVISGWGHALTATF